MRALLTRSFLLVFAGTLSATGLFAQGPSAVRKGVLEGVTNYSRVGDSVGCAGAITTGSIDAIKAEGFKSIVNLRLASEPGAAVDEQRAAATARGLRYHHLPFSTAAPDTAVLERFLAVAADPANSPMFLHCASANRVGAFWLVKRVKQDGWTVDTAIDEAAAIGLTNPALKQFALDYLGRAK
jgi:uncharacterized protein (TIGR01244 family)